jgi:hypothetical protein
MDLLKRFLAKAKECIFKNRFVMVPNKSHIIITEDHGKVKVKGRMEHDKMLKIMQSLCTKV